MKTTQELLNELSVALTAEPKSAFILIPSHNGIDVYEISSKRAEEYICLEKMYRTNTEYERRGVL